MEKVSRERFHGLDVLKIVLAIAVAYFHTLFFETRPNFVLAGPTGEIPQRPDFIHILSFNLIFLTVPVFMIVSAFLYTISRKAKPQYFKKRIGHLVILASFWLAVRAVWLLLTDPGWFSRSMNTPVKFILGILSGFSSLYWFFISLLVLVILLEIWLIFLDKLNKKHQQLAAWAAFLISLMVLGYLNFGNTEEIVGNPLALLPEVFVAPILLGYYERRGKNFPKRTIGLALLFTFLWGIFSWLDWVYFPWLGQEGKQILFLPMQGRISLLWGGLALFFWGLCRRKPLGKAGRLMVGFTLGIYGFQLLIPFTEDLMNLLKKVHFPLPVIELLLLTYRVLASILLTFLLKKIPVFRKVL